MAAPDVGDPAIGAAMLEQLGASIDIDDLMNVRHRELAAGLRRYLSERLALVQQEIEEAPPRFERRLAIVREAMRAAAARGAAIEDAIGHALVTGGLLGDLERVIMRRMLGAIEADLAAVAQELAEVAMDAAWIDHGVSG